LAPMQRLAQVGIALSAQRDLDTLLALIVEEACNFTGADGGTLYLLGNDQLHFSISINRSLGIKTGGPYGNDPNFPPLPLNPTFAAAFAAIHHTTVHIPDLDAPSEFDFSGPRRFEAQTGYHAVSMLATPMLDHKGEPLGVLQLLNAVDPATGKPGPFPLEARMLGEAMASLAGVSIRNVRLIRASEALFEALLEVMATALDARSRSTHGHVRRVADLTLALAEAIDASTAPPFDTVHFDKERLRELKIAGLLHDIGKIVSPPHIMDKATKLETIFDRAELIRTRYLAIEAQTEARHLCARLNGQAAGEEALAAEIAALHEELDFVLACNHPGEWLDDAAFDRLKAIAATTYVVAGIERPRLTPDELENLSIRKGSLTEAERKLMQSHIEVTQRMLAKIPFPRHLAGAPIFAGNHHEALDGSGYPQGLTGSQLPLQSRMLAVIDLLDALTDPDRPYRKQMPLEEAFGILQLEVDKGRLDGDVVRLLREEKIFERYREQWRGGETSSAL